MFLCVTANAAIDKTMVVPGFAPGRTYRPESLLVLPGGKGINVARGLRNLGETPLVTGWAGGHAGRFIAASLASEGIRAEFAWCGFESRTCLTVLDPVHGTLTDLNENGGPLAPDEVAGLGALFANLLPGAEFAAISGSLPAGAPDSAYADWIRLGRRAGVPVALDCGGEALRLGLEAGPTLIKPNQAEFQGLVGRPLDGLPSFAAAAGEVARRYGVLVALSLGAEGAIAARAGETWQARPPRLEITSTVGSGDALLAGLIQGMARGLALPEALRRGVAAGTANALTVGAGQFSPAEFERVLAGVEVERIAK